MSAYASGLTAMGAMSLTIKDALENRTPRDFSKPENMLEAISQGGAWALYGDLIVQALTNENSDFSKGQLGPVIGTVEDTFNLATKTVHSVFGDSKKGLKPKDMNKLINKVPFNNHFMLRPAMNALFLEDFMNASDPKRARRIRKMMRERGQSPIFE